MAASDVMLSRVAIFYKLYLPRKKKWWSVLISVCAFQKASNEEFPNFNKRKKEEK